MVTGVMSSTCRRVSRAWSCCARAMAYSKARSAVALKSMGTSTCWTIIAVSLRVRRRKGSGAERCAYSTRFVTQRPASQTRGDSPAVRIEEESPEPYRGNDRLTADVPPSPRGVWRAADEVITAYKRCSLEYGKAGCLRHSLRPHTRESGYNCL